MRLMNVLFKLAHKRVHFCREFVMARLFLFITVTFMSIAVIPIIARADNFQIWLSDLRVEAQKRGVSDATFDAALGDANQ